MAAVSLSSYLPKSFLAEADFHSSLGEELQLCENGNMVFHWADFHETCDVIKSKLETSESLKVDFKKREESIKRLSLIPVWIKTPHKVHQTTMYNLYERYLLNQSQSVGLDPFGPIDISFISGTGPFKSMAIAECFSRITYHDFVLVFLLKGQLPKRDFRIRLKSKVLLEYGAELAHAKLVNLEQMTTSGLLLSVESDLFLKEISQGQKMRLLLDSETLKNANGKNLVELKAYLSQFAFNLLYSSKKEEGLDCDVSDFVVQSSFDFFKNKKVYLFVSFNTLGKKNPKPTKILEGFISYSRKLVCDHYQDKNQKTA